MSKRKNFLIFLFVTFFVLLLDVATKRYTEQNISRMLSPYYPYGGIAVFKDFLGINFCITHATNTGAAWGVFSDYKDALLFVRVALIGGLIFYQTLKSMPLAKRIALAFVTAGAIGNVIDHFLYGHVIDMFLFSFFGYHFPVFNVADSFIFCGISYLFIEGLIHKKEKKAVGSSANSV